MKKKFNIIRFSITLGVIFYAVDTVLFYLTNGNEYTFIQALLPVDPISEIYSRLLLVSGIIIFGIILNGKFNELSVGKKYEQIQPQKTKRSTIDFSFLSSLSYQLRTPLNAIIGFSELLKKPGLTPDSKEIYIGHINSSSKYLLLLINNLSEISKIESNELSISRVETDVNRIIEELFQVFTIRKEEMGKSHVPIVIEKVRIKDSFNIMTDPERLKHVINNLLENALSQTESGMVKMGYVVKDNGFVEFFIKDSGKGYSQERLEIIFERYNKLTDNQNLPFDGSVLRLAISKSLVKLLGGEIWADSKPGQGATIYFTIPYMEVQTPKEEVIVKKASATASRDWSEHTILIAEDVESNYIYLLELLRSTNIVILWAKNGLEAVKMAELNPKIELVLMDILMPEMDGYQAAKEIKKMRPELPIVAQTAYMIEDSTKSEDIKSFSSYLIKPIWAPQLISTLENFIK